MIRRLLSMLIAAALVASLAIAGCSSNSTSSDNNGGNNGGGNSTNSFDKAVAANGGTAEYVFKSAGSVPYHCKPHPTMRATITVRTGGTPSLVTTTIENFQLPSLTVDVGDTVRWTNNDGVGHTVTSD